MKTCRQLGALLLSFSLMLSLGMNAFAAAEDTGFSDVDAGAWYAGDVYKRQELNFRKVPGRGAI